MPSLSPVVEKELMQVAQADSLRSKRLGRDKSISHQPLLLRFQRLTWAAGLAGLFLIVVSWLACYTLGKEVSDLKGRLEASRQELAAARYDLTVAQAEKQFKEDQERQQKAISALYFRMQELEEQVNRFSSPRTTFLQTELNGLAERRGGL
jgi:ABC-type transport system involved in cytochrome bd biosynthesis fused ATPase/permease subunit